MSDPTLTVSGLSVSYGSVQAVSDVSWSVESGEILAVIGPNGAGKSSCLGAVTNAVRHSGTISFEGRDVTRMPTHKLAKLGLRRTFQGNTFFPELSATQNVAWALDAASGGGDLKRRDCRDRAAELLAAVGVEERYLHRPPGELPFGVQRLLSIAIAYRGDAQALLIDEPAAGLSETETVELVQLMHHLRSEGLAVVLVEHNMSMVRSCADRVLVLQAGRTLTTGQPDEIWNDELVRRAYLG